MRLDWRSEVINLGCWEVMYGEMEAFGDGIFQKFLYGRLFSSVYT